jgi:hypothetical protein
LLGSVQYQNLSNGSPGGGVKEILVGLSPLSTSSPAGGDVTWAGGKPIMFTYNPVLGTLTTTVGSGAGAITASKNVGDLGGLLNYFEITIAKNSINTAIAFNNVALDAVALGTNFVKPAVANSTGPTCWSVTNIDVGTGFTLTGTLVLTGPFNGVDANIVRIDVGYVTPPDSEGPVTSNVSVAGPVYLNGPATVTAKVDDSTKGGSDIAAAEYCLNDDCLSAGLWTSMAAEDVFDSPTENVTATFTATVLGTNRVCVRGTDALGNTGDAACQYFAVQGKFDGFFSPIENNVVNVAKAGQSIPVKWRLTDFNDVAIDDPTSFTALFSYLISCSTLTGDPLEAVVEYAAGTSGLQYNGDGYWQFNWKTPKEYAGPNSCRAMFVEFKGGVGSPVVNFQFKK